MKDSRYRKLLESMLEYDSLPVGNDRRKQLGMLIDDFGADLKDKHLWQIAEEYEKMKNGAN